MTDCDMMGGMMGGGMMLLWWLLAAALLALVVSALAWLFRQLTNRGPDRGSRAGRPSAREELDRRYAAGDLAREDYLQTREDLRQ